MKDLIKKYLDNKINEGFYTDLENQIKNIENSWMDVLTKIGTLCLTLKVEGSNLRTMKELYKIQTGLSKEMIKFGILKGKLGFKKGVLSVSK